MVGQLLARVGQAVEASTSFGSFPAWNLAWISITPVLACTHARTHANTCTVTRTHITTCTLVFSEWSSSLPKEKCVGQIGCPCTCGGVAFVRKFTCSEVCTFDSWHSMDELAVLVYDNMCMHQLLVRVFSPWLALDVQCTYFCFRI